MYQTHLNRKAPLPVCQSFRRKGGYPLNENGDDKDADSVFKSVLGDDYEKKWPEVFKNACATRVSIALIESEMKLRKDFLVQQGKHKGKGFIASARGLKEFLFDANIWGPADKVIPGKSSEAEVAKEIGDMNGVYIILGGNTKKDHATLWIGGEKNAIGKRNYIDNGGTVYFWELKDDLVVKDNQIEKMYLSYDKDGNRMPLKSEVNGVWMSKYDFDINLEIEMKSGNDGKTVNITIDQDGQKIELSGIVAGNKVVFEKIFK
jgi:hypothetical protein